MPAYALASLQAFAPCSLLPPLFPPAKAMEMLPAKHLRLLLSSAHTDLTIRL